MINAAQANILKWLLDLGEGATWSQLFDQHSYRWEVLERDGLIKLWEHDKLPALYDITDTGRLALEEWQGAQVADDVQRTVEVPQLVGDFLTTKHVTVKWVCPICGGKRGEVKRVLSYDGSLRVNCDGWNNPCGHVDKYADVIKEAYALLLDEAINVKPTQQLLDEALARIAELEALLSEARAVLAPIVEAANDEDLEDYDSYLFAEPHEDYHVFINASDDTYLKMRHLRAVAEFASKLNAALKK